MDKKLNKIFLSASIPSPERKKKYYDTADFIAIRDSIRALATVVIPKAKLILGGHPAITPIIRNIMEAMKSDLSSHVTLYQSEWFKKEFPKENKKFEEICYTKKKNTKEESLKLMREEMIYQNDYIAGIFIGGMEGVEEEFELFSKSHSKALLLPIATTGAAAKIIFDKSSHKFDNRLKTEFTYMKMFKELLRNYL